MLASEARRRGLCGAPRAGKGGAPRKPEGKQSAGFAPQPRPYLPPGEAPAGRLGHSGTAKKASQETAEVGLIYV